jgi:bifunctional enzyme CysN/CysC
LRSTAPFPFAPYEENRELGGFILIDRIGQRRRWAAGMIHFALRRAHNIHWQHMRSGREARAAQKLHSPERGLVHRASGSGKSTIANLVEKKLLYSGGTASCSTGTMSGTGLNRDLGFTDGDRVEMCGGWARWLG